MFGRKNNTTVGDGVGTVIGKDTQFQGNVRGEGFIRIDGRVEGQIQYRGDVVVGEMALVLGDVKARNVLLAGRIKGNIEAEHRVEIVATGVLEGDLVAASLVVAEGAVLQGSSTMRRPEKNPAGRSNTPARDGATNVAS